MQTSATYFDGKSAAADQGSLTCYGSTVQFQTASVKLSFDIREMDLTAPIGSGEWIIELGDGASLRFSDDEIGRELRAHSGRSGWIDRLEGAWHWAVIALVVAFVGTWAFLTYAVPVGARYVAFSLPSDFDNRFREESIDLLDSLMFETSTLSEERKEHIQTLFSNIQSLNKDYSTYKLEFRASEDIGANAFAIPGGLVVITDEMVELASNDDEIVAVLAHEVGHLAQRHSMRIILQDSVSAVFIAGLTGDLTNITALSATIPTVLMQAKYSRDFEQEADEFSFAYLELEGIETDVLSELLQRIESDDGFDSAAKLSAWFSSHPQSVDRKPEQQD